MVIVQILLHCPLASVSVQFTIVPQVTKCPIWDQNRAICDLSLSIPQLEQDWLFSETLTADKRPLYSKTKEHVGVEQVGEPSAESNYFAAFAELSASVLAVSAKIIQKVTIMSYLQC